MKTLTELQNYKYRAARALLILQEYGLRHFLESWRKAKAQGVVLPETDNPAFESLEYLVRHVLQVAQENMTWICEKLGLPDPCITEPPDVLAIDKEADWYLIYLLEKLREPLENVEPERFYDVSYETPWKEMYTVHMMLEHLVCHAFRHVLQIEELCAAQQPAEHHQSV
ncbi:MAG TPA: hypothetical protein VGL38_08660 [bacterium]|jgi:hypothetical protein